MVPLPIQLAVVFLLGICLGSLVNWAIYALAWRPRAISPWSRLAPGASPRSRLDRVPVLGWIALRRDAKVHGPRFWIRPLVLELGLGLSLAGLYWWEVIRLGLIEGQVGVAVAPTTLAVHLPLVSHAVLLCWMLAASFIDIDEKIIPDEITVSGTVLGLLLAAAVPMSLLPHVADHRVDAPVVGAPLRNAASLPLWLEPTTAVAPRAWPPDWGQARHWQSLVIALACYWLWCFALAPRIWRGRRGTVYALGLIVRRVARELCRPPLSWLGALGTTAIIIVWAVAEASWAGLMTALVGLVASGGIVWAVRLIGTAALRREAMGFGDVTLMMMIGTFLGWQACLVAFFLAPFAGLVAGVTQFALRRDDVIPYGPFLCLGAAAVTVFWAPIWSWAQPLFGLGGLVPAVLAICLALLGGMLYVWRIVKTALLGGMDEEANRARGGGDDDQHSPRQPVN